MYFDIFLMILDDFDDFWLYLDDFGWYLDDFDDLVLYVMYDSVFIYIYILFDCPFLQTLLSQHTGPHALKCNESVRFAVSLKGGIAVM